VPVVGSVLETLRESQDAARFVEYCQKNRPFKKFEEILEMYSSGQFYCGFCDVASTGLSPEVSETLRKSRHDSQTVGAVVGARERPAAVARGSAARVRG
jgi:hypothetical protein